MAAGIRQVLHSMDSNHPQARPGHQRSAVYRVDTPYHYLAVYRVLYTIPLPGSLQGRYTIPLPGSLQGLIHHTITWQFTGSDTPYHYLAVYRVDTPYHYLAVYRVYTPYHYLAVYRVWYTIPLPGDHIITGIPTLNKLTNLLALTVVKHFRHEMVPRQSPPNPANVFLCSLKSEFEDNI